MMRMRYRVIRRMQAILGTVMGIIALMAVFIRGTPGASWTRAMAFFGALLPLTVVGMMPMMLKRMRLVAIDYDAEDMSSLSYRTGRTYRRIVLTRSEREDGKILMRREQGARLSRPQ